MCSHSEDNILTVNLKEQFEAISSNGAILVFAGTKEGRLMGECVSELGIGHRFFFSVATDYGKELLEDIANIQVLEGRLTEDDICHIIEEKKIEIVIDSTHPYAVIVTENIKNACKRCNTAYFRCFRNEAALEDDSYKITADELGEGLKSGYLICESIEHVVRVLNEQLTGQNVLLTTGAKELAKYQDVTDKKNRLFVRVLPSHDSLDKAMELGLPMKNIIAMQGPFSRELNIAMLQKIDTHVLVTKSTGSIGGFQEKLDLVKEGFTVIIISRPTSESGLELTYFLDSFASFAQDNQREEFYG